MDEGIRIVANLMKLAARTAPKAIGQDFIDVRLILGTEREILANEMLAHGKATGSEGYVRDGNNLLASHGCVLIGLKRHPGIGADCGGCGFGSCAEMAAAKRTDNGVEGPNCILRLQDLGIAVGSAAKVASDHNVDNRVMFRMGVAARRLKLMDCTVITGIPLSATGKNIFFDRKA